MKITISDSDYNHQLPIYDRKMITSSSALGILRHQLVKNIGLDRIKGFLFRFGWDMGVDDAKKAMETNMSIVDLIKCGPKQHSQNGHFLATQYEGFVETDESGQRVISIYGTGTWNHSYEALEHTKRIGTSTTPVCHTLVGYSSGFMSTVCKQQVFAKEVSCVGRGDSECRWVVRGEQDWSLEEREEFLQYNETPIVQELEYTYEQLLEQKNFVMQLADFQKKLTEEIANGCDLQAIANIVYDITQIPTIIEDIDFRTIGYSGLSENLYVSLKDDMKQYIQKNDSINRLGRREKNQLPFRKKIIETDNQTRVITPIQVEKEVVAYCAFIYYKKENINLEKDYLLLDRFANAVSLILFNEKTKFESFERMKGNFLEQILDGQFPVEELIDRGKYTGLDLGQPFYMAVMKYEKMKMSLEEEFRLQEQILETTAQYFYKLNQNVLVGRREGNLVLFISKEIVKKSNISPIMKQFHRAIMKKYSDIEFKFGISSEEDDIKKVQESYEEAMIALRLSNKQSFVSFDSLGIVGVMINSNNTEKIMKLAEQKLGVLIQSNDKRNKEHLKTLYVFLLNGGNLEQTMNDLYLSMSGLRHRLKKIESLLDMDLRDPNETHQLMLILKSLIALGELEIEY